MTTFDLAAQSDSLFAANRPAEAFALIGRHAASGDAAALYLQALHVMSGDFVQRDVARARDILHRAVVAGHPDALMLEIALTANGSGAPADWQAARRLLDQATDRIPAAREQLALLNAMAIDDEGRPLSLPAAEMLSDAPDVRRFRNLLSPEECAHLAMAARDMLAPATVVDPRTGRMIVHPIRTSDGAVIGPGRENLVIRAINQRLAVISDTLVTQGEPLSILRYSPGQEYRPHLDWIGDAKNQRTKTVIVYLNHGYKGGETRFISASLTVEPQGGDAILFSNILPDGSVDRRSDHAGLPVRQGAKWIATRWIRERAHDPWHDR
ncbi:2OG-Fe(II) oxygenase [Sphingomonas sp. RT2P30]|uniref:2OG-Fe(II) oxygenase n=1 Tax=Parasphingomonas halimpatiens TaxID=3096162 RepID=UPI002FC70CD9